MSVVRRATGDS